MGSGSILEPAMSKPRGRVSPCEACPVRPLSVCNVLKAEELVDLAAILKQVEVKGGAPVFHEGDPAAHLFNVTGGCLKVYKLLPDGRRQIIGFLFPGDFLGLAVAEDYAYSAEAVVDSSLCRFQQGRLQSLMERYPKLELRLLSKARDELAVAQEQMLLLGRKTAKEKLVTFLIQLSDLAGKRGESANPLDLPITRSDIADYLGLTTETVSRTFSQLRKEGLIAILPGGQVDLLEREQLEGLAQGF